MIEISESFFFLFFLGIRYPSGDIVVVLHPFTYILETLRLSLINFFLILISFGCFSLTFLSSKLADEIDIVLVFGVIVSSVSILEEDLDLSNEVNLFNAMYFSVTLLIGVSYLVCDAFYWSVLKLPINSLTVSSVGCINGIIEDTILCIDLF